MPAQSDCGRPTYRLGTLVYTRSSLFVLFSWMLWGDFCITLMETAWPKILPLQLKDAGASNVMMGLIAGSLPAAVNAIVNPFFSFRSDRFRSRWGRRIPFLFVATPFLSLLLAVFGFAETIAGGLHSVLDKLGLGLSPLAVTLGFFGVLVLVFQVFNVVVSSAYPYLFTDVVPRELMGRFNALMRVVSTAATYVFHTFIFGFAEDHRREIYLGAAALYFTAFMLLCWKVREGEYPPPEPTKGGGLRGAVRTYLSECFGHPIYIFFNIAVASWVLGGTAQLFHTFLGQQVGMGLDGIGKVNGWLALGIVALLFPCGWLVDRFHPIRVMLFAGAAGVVYSFAAIWAVRDGATFTLVTLASLPVAVAYTAAQFPLFVAIWPKSRFGQFASAQAIVSSVALILGNTLAGRFLDWLDDYRYLYLWQGTWLVVSVLCFAVVWRYWSRLGGSSGYVSPIEANAASPLPGG